LIVEFDSVVEVVGIQLRDIHTVFTGKTKAAVKAAFVV
jgi:hypothetical protein